MKECNKTSTEDKKKIYSMKKVGTFEAKKTGFVNTVVEGTPGVNASAASSVTISGSEHNQYQHFLGVCREDPVNLFSIGEEEEFDEDDTEFAFYFFNVGDISLIDVEGEWTLSSRMSVSDVAKVGRVAFAESEWEKQGLNVRPIKNMIKPSGKRAMEGTAPINEKERKRTLCWW